MILRERPENVREDVRVPLPDPDLLIDFDNVLIRRGGSTLVGPVTWKVELDERWVVLGQWCRQDLAAAHRGR